MSDFYLTINGEKMTFAEQEVSLPHVLKSYEGRRLAVAVNGKVVPRSLWEAHQLQQGDHIEIVHCVTGG